MTHRFGLSVKIPGADEVDVKRRSLLLGAAASMAGSAAPDTAVVGVDQSHDRTIQFLSRGFETSARDMVGHSGDEQIRLFRRMAAYASAMAVIPASGRHAIETKRVVANWSWIEGPYTHALPALVRSDLIVSADRDEDGDQANGA